MSQRRRYAQGTGRNAPRLQVIPGASSFPRKREPTRIAPTDATRPVPKSSPGPSSFPRKREPTHRAAKAGTYWRPSAYAKAGAYPIAPRLLRARPQYPLLAAFAASSPLLGRGGQWRLCASMGDSRLRGNDDKGAGVTVMGDDGDDGKGAE